MPELVTMVKGMRVASRAVGSALLMLVSLTYVFALPMYAQLKQEAGVGHHFGSLLMTMGTLLIYGTFLDSVGESLDQMLAITVRWSRVYMSAVSSWDHCPMNLHCPRGTSAWYAISAAQRRNPWRVMSATMSPSTPLVARMCLYMLSTVLYVAGPCKYTVLVEFMRGYM